MRRPPIPPRLAAALLWLLAAALPAHAETLGIGGTGASQGTVRMLTDSFSLQRPDVAFELPRSLGSGGGIQAVLAGVLDIATSGRPLTPAEKQAGAVAVAYAMTPLMVVTSHPTFRASISNQDVVAIFGRQRTAWPDGGMIRIVLRPDSEADVGLMKQYFPGIGPALESTHSLRTIPVATTDQDNIDAAERLPGSFAVTCLAIVLSEGRTGLTALPLDGIAPTLANLQSGAYRYAKQLWFVTRPTLRPVARDFLAFVAAPAGQRVLREAGNLPLPLPLPLPH